MPEPTIIRCSSLPTWTDCPRRWMATLRKGWLIDLGFELNDTPISIGAHVGSGSHSAVARSWEGRFTSDDFSPIDEALDCGYETLRKRMAEEGVLFDQTTPDVNVAELAIAKIVRAYRKDVRPDRRPQIVEGRLRIAVAPGFELRGHTDLFARDGSFYDADSGTLDDLKTGVRVPYPGAQLGGYDLALEANTGEAPKRTTMTFVRRVRKTADQPPPMTVAFDRRAIRKEARRAVGEIVEACNRFDADPNKDPFEFRANPNSFLCGRKYCPAYGSSQWCPESRVKALAEGN